MPMATDIGKFSAADWQAAAEREGVSVEELKKRQEQRHKERQEREREKAAKENEKKEQEKAEKKKLAEEKRKKEKTNRERLVRQISVHADGGNYGYFRNFKPNFGKLADTVKTNISNLDGTNFSRSTVSEILRDIKFSHNYDYIGRIELDSNHEYDVESFYRSFGRLKKFKLEIENLKLKFIIFYYIISIYIN
jgi:hypothetical protein